MKFLLEFKQFYKVGDKILIQYWYNDMVTPVIITQCPTKRSYKISHDIPESKIQNAPDEVISKGDIIDHFRQ